MDEIEPAPLLFDPFVRIGRVAEDEEVELFELAAALKRLVRGAKALINPHDFFVVNGEDQGGAGAFDAP